MTDSAPRGLRILLVEDEAMISMLLEDMLIDEGAAVVGPAATTDAALREIAAEQIDGALLDVNLGGQQSFGVAEALAERGIPFVFVTGYGEAGVRSHFPEARTLQKPFVADDLRRALEHLAAHAPSAGSGTDSVLG